METTKLKNYLVVRYVVLSVITATLITSVFFAFHSLSNSLQDKKNNIATLVNFKESITEIESSIKAYVNAKDLTTKSNLKKYILVEIKKINFESIFELQQIFKIPNSQRNIPSRLKTKKFLAGIEKVLSNDLGQSNKLSILQNLDKSIEQINAGTNNLISSIFLNQQEIILSYKKTNTLVWLGSLICLQLLIIFLYRPLTKKITTETNILQKEKEDAITATRAKSGFIATLSHEIRTPLNGVLGLTSLVLETRLSQEQREYLELVHDSGNNLLQVINDIFDFSKIESGRLQLDQMYFSIHNCVNEVVETYLPKATKKNIQLLHLIEPDVPEYLLGDYKRMVQCLSNFVNNAIKFTRKGEIVIRANLINAVEDMYEIQFSISDTGIGIPESKLTTIFTPFKNEKAPAAKRFEGTGLGLAICSQIVELMNGRIWVESEINKGSTFYFATHFQADKKESHFSVKKDIRLLADKHIVILDANETSRKILTVQCHNWGMHPKASGSLHETSDILTNNKNISFALLDLDMIERENDIFISEINAIAKERNIHILYMRSRVKRIHNSQDFEDCALLSKQVKQAQLYESLIKIVIKEQPKKNGALDVETNKIPLSLLLAEDNIINQKLMERFISRIGYNIDVAHNGIQAVKMSSEKNYNIIFMDLQMPEMDGIDATRKILAVQNENPKPKIIAMTANVRTEDMELCFEVGMVDYIPKPISFEKVKYLLGYWGKISLEERN